MAKTIKNHLFICSFGKDCAAKNGAELRAQLKTACTDLEGVRINASGCLGRCGEGIVGVLYPEGKWYTNLKESDVDTLKSELVKKS